jgi:hypothetical protein
MSKHDGSIQVQIGEDTRNAANRVSRGVVVGAQAAQSALYVTYPDLKLAVDGVTADTAALQAAVEAWQRAGAALRSAASSLGTALSTWDGSYGVLVALAEKRCQTPADCASLGLVPREVTHNPLAPPLGIALKQDLRRDLLRIHVLRAPGMRSVVVEVSTDPPTPTSWRVLDGNGARHAIPHPPKGTTWVRAASFRANAKSDYTTPATILIV